MPGNTSPFKIPLSLLLSSTLNLSPIIINMPHMLEIEQLVTTTFSLEDTVLLNDPFRRAFLGSEGC